MDSIVETIRTGHTIPKDVARHIRKFISEKDYYKVAGIHSELITGITLKNLVFYDNKITDRNIEPAKTLMRLALQHAQSAEYSRKKIIDFLGEGESEALQKLNEQAA